MGSLPERSPKTEGRSFSWIYLSANKTVVEDNICTLAKEADVILSTHSINELKSHGIEAGSDTIFSQILPFAEGSVFDRKVGSSLLLEALSGFLSANGSANREPLRMPGNIVDSYTGVCAGAATLAALWNRLNTGQVEHLVTSQLDALTAVVPFVRSQYVGAPEKRWGGPATGVRLHPMGDGKVSGNLADPLVFEALMDAVGITYEDVPKDLQSTMGRQDTAKLNEFLRQKTQEADAVEVFQSVMLSGAPRFGLYQSVRELSSNEQISSLGFMSAIQDTELGRLPFPGLPAEIEGINTPPVRRSEISKNPKWSDIRLANESKPSVARPLEGARIVDFTQAWIGPFAAMMLGDLGAEVIKVEGHRRMDVWRNWRGQLPESRLQNPDAKPYNISPNFNSTNRNKRSMAIDLTRSEGIVAVKNLIRTADVVMSNFTPRVMKKFGLDYTSLLDVKKDIVSVSWSGYGTSGPYRDFKANGATIEALCGWDCLFGYSNEEPMVMGFYQADAFCGMQMAAITLLALINRNLSGEGQNVQGSMLATAIGYIGEEVLASIPNTEERRWGNRHADYAPHGVFPTNEADEWIAIVCTSDREWCELAHLIGLEDNRFEMVAERLNFVDELEDKISDWTKTRRKDDIVAELQSRGIGSAPVLNTLEILENQEYIGRNWFTNQHHKDIGDILHAGFPWQFSESALRAEYPPPRLGEHTRELLQSMGYDEARIDSLIKQDVVGVHDG